MQSIAPCPSHRRISPSLPSLPCHSAGKDIKVGLDEPRIMSLDDALEYINDDEQVEVTPKNVRIRKDPLAPTRGKKK